MTLVRVHNPAYAPLAQNGSPATGPGAVLPTLDNARVAVLFNGWPTWQVMLERFFADLRERHPSASAKQYLIPRGHAAATELLEEVAAESDCAIVGLGNCGSCTAWSYHDSLELLKSGLPTVWVITREFESLASAMRLSRPAELPTVTLPVNPESVSEADAIALMERTIPSIVGGLVGDDAPAAVTVPSVAEPRHAEVPEDQAEAFDLMYARGWTDGLPVISPTEERVERMLAGIEAAPAGGARRAAAALRRGDGRGAGRQRGHGRLPARAHAHARGDGRGGRGAGVQSQRDRDHDRFLGADDDRQRPRRRRLGIDSGRGCSAPGTGPTPRWGARCGC